MWVSSKILLKAIKNQGHNYLYDTVPKKSSERWYTNFLCRWGNHKTINSFPILATKIFSSIPRKQTHVLIICFQRESMSVYFMFFRCCCRLCNHPTSPSPELYLQFKYPGNPIASTKPVLQDTQKNTAHALLEWIFQMFVGLNIQFTFTIIQST